MALRHSCFTGLHGWNALAEALAQAYIHDITANQVRSNETPFVQAVLKCRQISI